METKTFIVPNISCDHCVMTIKNEVSDLSGVVTVEADKDTRKVTVKWEVPATWQQIENTLKEINYPPEQPLLIG
jgi:copper chaperone